MSQKGFDYTHIKYLCSIVFTLLHFSHLVSAMYPNFCKKSNFVRLFCAIPGTERLTTTFDLAFKRQFSPMCACQFELWKFLPTSLQLREQLFSSINNILRIYRRQNFLSNILAIFCFHENFHDNTILKELLSTAT